jgi:hypothetical protein
MLASAVVGVAVGLAAADDDPPDIGGARSRAAKEAADGTRR